MFWYIFTIVICSLVIAGSFIARKMSRNAAELNIVTETFRSSGRAKPQKFCFISDVHISMMPVKWGDILTAIKEEDPEFVLITGDLVNKTRDIERARQFVLTIALGAEVPVIITPGNHDNDVAASLNGGKKEFIDAFTSLKADVRVIDDGYTVVGSVLIGGLNDFNSACEDPGKLIDSWSRIAKDGSYDFVLATHNADMLLKQDVANASCAVSGEGPSCVLCGHTHGGQIRLVRHIEFKTLKKDVLPKKGIYYGRHKVGPYEVYITSGLGCAMFPLRHGTRPEVVVVNLSLM